MDKISISEILAATGGKLIKGEDSGYITAVSTDSREVGPRDLFVPLIGEVHDAHKFIPQVLEKGCGAVLVSREDAVPEDAGCAVILVENTLRAMQALAKYYLDKLNLRRVAVTGSVGKTSTRDMLYHICSAKYPTGRPIKNFNNPIGVPIVIFGFDSSLEMAVFEEGMDRAGMIHEVTQMTRPEVAVITNVGISHIEHLGSRDNIRKAKLEITDFFTEANTLIINAGNDMLDKDQIIAELKEQGRPVYNIITVGEEGSAKNLDYIVKDIRELGEEGVVFTLERSGEEFQIPLGVPGRHNATNASLAIAAGEQFGISIEEAISGLSELEFTGRRLRYRKAGELTVIDDSYNAAPDSMKSGIGILMSTKAERRVAILGDMYELGSEELKYHAEIGEYAAEKGVDLLIAVGEMSEKMAEAAKSKGGIEVMHFATAEELKGKVKVLVRKGDAILVKASNGMHLGIVADELCQGEA